MPAEDSVSHAETDQLMSFLYACPVGLLEISSSGDVLMINPMAMQLLMRMSSLPCMNFYYVLERCAPEIRNLKEGFTAKQGTVCENYRIFADLQQSGGDISQPNVFSCTLIKLTSDRYAVSLHDISKQVHQEQRLKQAESWFSSLMNNGSDFSVASLNADGKFESVSAGTVSQTGFAVEELLGKHLSMLDASHPSLGAEKQLTLAARDGWHLDEDWLRHKDQTELWYQRLVAVRHSVDQGAGAQISGYTVVFRGGNRNVHDLSRLKQMLTRDHLTNAYNRMHFYEVAEKARAEARRCQQPLAVIAMDVDLFKRINDSYGHPAGDLVLREFAARCDALMHPSDTMARTGGEEFTVLLPHTNIEAARSLAEELRRAIEHAPFKLEAADVRITGSFGCAEINESYDLEKMLTEADVALYRAKAMGRNRVVAEQSGA